MPRSVPSDKAGYCELVFTSLGNIYLNYWWALYHLEKQAGCYKGSCGQGDGHIGHIGDANPAHSRILSLFRGEDRTPRERNHKDQGISLHPTAHKCVPTSSKDGQEEEDLLFGRSNVWTKLACLRQRFSFS